MGMTWHILLGLLIVAALHEAGASSVLHRWWPQKSRPHTGGMRLQGLSNDGLAMRLRGGVEFEDVTTTMDDAGAVDVLKQAVERLKADKSLLFAPEMEFFRDYLQSMGAKIDMPRKPKSSSTYTHTTDTPAPPPEAEEEESEDEEADMLDEDVIPEANADLEAPQPAPDMSKEPSEEEYSKAAELKAAALEAASTDPAKAADIWSQIIALAPNANAIASRGACYVAMKKPLAAIRDADSALQINADSAKGYKTRGKAHAMLGHWVEAVKDLGTGQAIDYDDDTATFQASIKDKADKIVAKEARKRRRDLKKKEKEQQAELKRRKEEAIKRRQQEVEEENERERAAEAAAGGMGGRGRGGPGGMPAGMDALFSDPEIMKAMQNPKVMQAMMEMQTGGPAAMAKYASDPEIMGLMMKIQSKMGGGGGGGRGGMGGGMGGGMPGMPGGFGGMPGMGGMGGMHKGGGGGGYGGMPEVD